MNPLDTNHSQATPSVATNVLQRIEREAITPIPKVWFLGREYLLWILWGTTVLIGALAVSVTLYISMNAQYALYEATHQNFFTFFVSVLPYLWVILFAAMVYLAVVEIKQTKRGYRYRTIEILGSSLLFSLIGGVLFQYAGFGYLLDQSLGHQLAVYMSMEKMELRMWQMPEEGRVIGMLVPRPDQLTRDSVLSFEDIDGKRWGLNSQELSERELFLLLNEPRVRLLGTTTESDFFHICGVFPWMYKASPPREKMLQARHEFEVRLLGHHSKPPNVFREGEEMLSNVVDSSSPCAKIAAVERFLRR